MIKNLLFIFGTRPETIKLAPIIREFRQRRGFDVSICVTAQHRQLLDRVLESFEIKPNFDLNIMTEGQSLFDIVHRALDGLNKVISEWRGKGGKMRHLIFVQGDTSTTLLGAITAYYHKIPVAYVESGLRSGDRYNPFPEELNRIMTSHLVNYHFAPTNSALRNLKKEGISQYIYKVGNSVVDALQYTLKKVANKRPSDWGIQELSQIDYTRRILLVTAHRRESFGSPLEQICKAIKEIALSFKDVEIVYPAHLNPNVQRVTQKLLIGSPRIHLIKPLAYEPFVWLMAKSYLILTDSGGIQEEAPSLGKPVLVMRQKTERPEGIKTGVAKLVGVSQKKIVYETAKILREKPLYSKMAKAKNPYGDGKTSKRIANIIEQI